MAVERLHKENYEELMDFVDLVFSQDLLKVHFQEDLPYCFGPDEEHMQMQYVYRDETGRIRSAIGVIPYTYMVGDTAFSVRTITNVATHHRYTGKGYMQTIMKKVFEDMETENVDLVILHGNRERYRHFGFESAGLSESASFRAYNIKNRQKRGERYDYQFRELNPEDRADVEACLSLFEAEPQHFKRTVQDFCLFQKMWHGRTYLIYDGRGIFQGYLNYCDHFSPIIRELELISPDKVVSAVNSFMLQQKLSAVTLAFSPFRTQMSEKIYDAAENVSCGQTTRLHLLKPEKFIEACMNLKIKSKAYMPEGSLVLQTPWGNLSLEVKKKTAYVGQTQLQAEVTLSVEEVYSFLFGPSPRIFLPEKRNIGERNAWFPLPFYIHNTDLY